MPPILRRIFWFVNKFFMVPLFRCGLGFFMGNPFSGYIMVIKVVGRKSGKIRYAPVNYSIHEGNIYCISGGRQNSDWYRNVMATPRVELILPAGAVYGVVDEIVDSQERLPLVRSILINAGFAGFFEGYNPRSISDAELLTKCADLPVLRIRPTGLGSGAADPGGWAAIWALCLTIGLIWALLR